MTIEPIGITSIIGSALVTGTVYDLADDNETIRGTTVTSFAISVTSVLAAGTVQAKDVDITNKYIESLSDEQLIEMENMLTQNENVITIENNIQKVKKL